MRVSAEGTFCRSKQLLVIYHVMSEDLSAVDCETETDVLYWCMCYV